jgi:hypothetical protein
MVGRARVNHVDRRIGDELAPVAVGSGDVQRLGFDARTFG